MAKSHNKDKAVCVSRGHTVPKAHNSRENAAEREAPGTDGVSGWDLRAEDW